MEFQNHESFRSTTVFGQSINSISNKKNHEKQLRAKIERTRVDVCRHVVFVREGEGVERDGVVNLREPLVPLERMRQRHRVVLLEDVRHGAGHCLDEHPEAVSVLNRRTLSAW